MKHKIRTLYQLAELSSDEFEILSLAVDRHRAKCRCGKCLRWLVLMGPEDTGSGWGFGPFTEAEFVAAGGIVPPYAPGDESPF